MTAVKDLTDKKFGRLTVVRFVGMRRFNSDATASVWQCRCECGKLIEMFASNLRVSKSCGCARTERWMTYRLKRRKRSA
jgi:hypothetical protein